ncbi:hypothetical protein OJ996_20910 [Luteolibacter sp. GHJ8]|uniref:DhnA family fructose-bisphosphate aldolase class Ia n=1 Tax=Luteolibacter rhizosphaerae TaxID=2989719 RepID=A0ABT3G880_9BACT|nr:hypothetical protein [Luteolibacter rhizosphaerae]MCW1916062.1 hypothetical protein [Luteolibacter rhizosphaerae]
MKARLTEKLEAIRRGTDPRAFILADAKDADMAWGLSAPGAPYPADGPRWKSMPHFRQDIREVVEDGVIDILLASASQMSLLAHRQGVFRDSQVTPAIRANDTTDIWCGRGTSYRDAASRPFSSCYLEEAMYGSLQPAKGALPAVDLGLYSITFNNDLEADHESLTAFKAFRAEAQRQGFNYFLEVFAPNLEGRVAAADLPDFINDQICRTLAGVPMGNWPVFLKIPFLSPEAMEDLAAYDPGNLIVGILGGSSGTTYDAFKLLAEAQNHGARVALFGRKIKDAEHPVEFIRHLRRITDGEISAEEAVKSYHGVLQTHGLSPKRELADDMTLTANELSYAR